MIWWEWFHVFLQFPSRPTSFFIFFSWMKKRVSVVVTSGGSNCLNQFHLWRERRKWKVDEIRKVGVAEKVSISPPYPSSTHKPNTQLGKYYAEEEAEKSYSILPTLTSVAPIIPKISNFSSPNFYFFFKFNHRN